MIQPIQLRQCPARETAPDAWFLPGDSAGRWLDELARCGLAGMETRLFVIPQSARIQRAAGLLVIPARPGSQRPAGIACCRIAGRLFVPADATLHPPVSESEVRALCPLPVAFFHPAFGLSGFEDESTLRVSDLVESPQEKPGGWNFARPGEAPLPSLAAVILNEPPSIQDIFGGAEEEIGNEPLTNLPPAPGEPGENAGARALQSVRRAILKGVAGALQRVPHTGSVRTWINGVEDWANRGLRGMSGQLERLRNKELHRLLRMLDSDPEAGLRHAIPLNNFAHRGVAPPGARLGTNSLNFDPRRLGGGPADFWNMPSDLQANLTRRYREMADREMQLGRHHRAAYIYAQLLGDLVSAANALKQGKLYREAAILYEERLQNPLEAARCLALGGLLAEAIERYEKLGLWLEVADLHERAGNRQAAENAIRRVVQDRLTRSDFLGAARLVDERLRAPDEALEILIGAWPATQQAGAAIEVVFQMLARLGRHDAALQLIARFEREALNTALVLPLLAAVGGPARFFPHQRVRHRAADFSRVIIAQRLGQPNLSRDEAGRLLEHLVRLAPEDRLLSRDANRHLADRRDNELRARRATPPSLPGKLPSVHRRFELPRQIQWIELRRDRQFFYALGATPKRLTLVRGVWDGEFQSLSWGCPAEALKHGFVFEPFGAERDAVALRCQVGAALEQKAFPAADLFFNRECLAGTPPWHSPMMFPVAIGEDAAWSVHIFDHQAILSCHDQATGRLRSTVDITADLIDGAERDQTAHVSIAAIRTGVALALGNRLVVTRGDGGRIRVDLPGQAVRLVSTPAHTLQGVAVMLEHGAVMHWVGSDTCIQLDDSIQSPICAFLPLGPLVLISRTANLVLQVDSRGVHNVVRMALEGQRALGICATARSGEFATLGEAGQMTIYRLPS